MNCPICKKKMLIKYRTEKCKCGYVAPRILSITSREFRVTVKLTEGTTKDDALAMMRGALVDPKVRLVKVEEEGRSHLKFHFYRTSGIDLSHVAAIDVFHPRKTLKKPKV